MSPTTAFVPRYTVSYHAISGINNRNKKQDNNNPERSCSFVFSVSLRHQLGHHKARRSHRAPAFLLQLCCQVPSLLALILALMWLGNKKLASKRLATSEQARNKRRKWLAGWLVGQLSQLRLEVRLGLHRETWWVGKWETGWAFLFLVLKVGITKQKNKAYVVLLVVQSVKEKR